MLLAALGSVRIGKNCDLGLENAARGRSLGHSFSLYGPPSRPITYIYVLVFVSSLSSCVSIAMSVCNHAYIKKTEMRCNLNKRNKDIKPRKKNWLP